MNPKDILAILSTAIIATTIPLSAYADNTCTANTQAVYVKKVTAAKQAFMSAKANASTALTTAMERARNDTARKRNYVDKDESNISLGEHRRKEELRARAVYNRTVQKETRKRDALLGKARAELRTALARCQ